MSQTLLAAHQVVHVANIAAGKLPRPKKTVTIPVIVIFAVLALIAVVRKLIALALLAVIVCVVFLLYQSGAFNHWVDKGKAAVNTVKTNSLTL
jgi:predicted RND superfamily exporter protein